MHEYWLVVANSTIMKLYRFNEKNMTVKEMEEMHHLENRLQPKDVNTDKEGRAMHGHGSLEPKETFKKMEEKKFAKEIAEMLHKAYEDKQFDRLYLACSPELLGILRPYLSKEVTKFIFEEISKDLTKSPRHDLWSHFKTVSWS